MNEQQRAYLRECMNAYNVKTYADVEAMGYEATTLIRDMYDMLGEDQ